MASLSAYYPLPVVAGTTAGTYAEGDDSRITGAVQSGGVAGGGLSGTYPNPTLAPVIPTGAQRSQAISRRFAETINVKDYGAVGDGVADDWLAIQRAIYDCALPPESRNGLSISGTETTTWGNRTILQLYRPSQGLTEVLFPQGSYRITKPLVVCQGVVLKAINSGGSNVVIINDAPAAGGQFPCITDLGYIGSSDESATAPSTNAAFVYNHNTWICGLNFAGGAGQTVGNAGYQPNQSGAISPEYAWYKWPTDSASYALVNGASGSSELTSSFGFNYRQGGKIKLYPSGEILDVAYADGSKIYLKNPLSGNVVNATYAFGFEKHCGILMAGGEGSKIQNCWANAFLGAGFFIFGGSPSPIIENTMANFCDVAYRIFNAPTVLIKPSGDCNNQIIKCEGFTNTTLISGKFEDPRPATGPYTPNLNVFVPYPNMTQVKPMFEVEGLPSGTPTFFSVNGCTQNGTQLSNVDQPFVRLWTLSVGPIVKLDGVRTLGANYRAFVEHYFYNGTLFESIGRNDLYINNDERHFYSGSSPYYSSILFNGKFGSNQQFGTNSELAGVHAVRDAGIQLDLQNKQTQRRSGRMPNLMRFTRSGTTATIEYRNSTDTAAAAHGLNVGDVVYFRNYTFTSGTGNLAWNSNIRDGAYFPSFYIKSVPTPETFTINVANSGATAGSANIWGQHYVNLHTLTFDEHQIQMPRNVGSTYTYDWTDQNNPISEYRAFTIYDRKQDVVASLAVPSVDTGNWWVKQQFSGGGTIANPAFRILHGSGAPSAAAPNGSIYLRTDGDASSTVYVRAGNVWRPLGAYEP